MMKMFYHGCFLHPYGRCGMIQLTSGKSKSLCPKAARSHHQPSPPEVKTLITWGQHPGRKTLLSQIMRKTSQSQCRPELLTPVSSEDSGSVPQACSGSLLFVLSLGITKTWLRLAAEQKVKMVALWN